ncbi:MAG TPA: PD-(D/E)XK nuclease family protein, partial [Fervidobacterium nodosum]|nr:PD-(D/E)XK nuclease family protein [Fervidobacterium nodosum]
DILEILEKQQEKQKKSKSEVSLLLSSLLETSREVIEGKNIHRRLMSVQRYPDLLNLVERGELPEKILKADVIKYLFENSDKVISEWRIAKSVVIDGKKYTLFGVPDKVFFKDGKIYVVDFKSSYLKDGSEEVEKYKFQLQFYMYMLKDFGEIAGGYLVGARSGFVIRVERPGDDFIELLAKLIRNLEVI